VSEQCGCINYDVLDLPSHIPSILDFSQSTQNLQIPLKWETTKYDGWRVMKIGSSSLYQHNSGLNLSSKSNVEEFVKMKEGNSEHSLNYLIPYRFAVSKKIQKILFHFNKSLDHYVYKLYPNNNSNNNNNNNQHQQHLRVNLFNPIRLLHFHK
jgi:hypothetical protein